MLKRNFDIVGRGIHPGYNYPGFEENGSKPGATLDIIGLINIGRRRLPVILGIAAIGTLLTIVYSMQLTPLYTASATVLVDPRQKNIVDAEAVLSGIGGDWAALESEVEIIRSAAVAERVIKRLNLDKADPPGPRQQTFFGRIAELVFSREAQTSPVDDGNRINYLARRFSSAIRVERLNDTYVIGISYMDSKPKFAAQVANAFADEYLIDQLEAKFEATRRANEWLNERVGELRKNVRDAERAVELFKAEKDIVEADGSDLDEQQIARLNEQLILARAQSAEAKARLDQLTDVKARGGEASSFADQLQSRIISELRSKLSEVRREYAELSSKYGRRHPSVINVGAQISDVQRQLDAEIDRIEASTRNAYDVARSREESIEASLQKLRGRSATNSQDAIRLRELERDAAATRALFESFLARFKETSEQESLQSADSRIIERAVVPTSPSWPSKKLIAVIGAFISLCAGIGVAFLLELLDRGFRTGEQLEEATGAPVLASIPVLAPVLPGRSPLSRMFGSKIRATEEAALARELTSRQVLDHPLSPFTEAIRSLRMGLRYANLDNPSKVVLVTSALPGEGKSTIASNLAQHAANTGEKVLLIDMDLRHPALSEVYAQGSAKGIVELVTGEAKISSVVKVDPQSKLRFIPATRSSMLSHTSEVLGSKKIKDFLNQVRDIFDLIVIDSSPLLPVTDGRALIDSVDSVLLVVKWEATNQDAVKSAFRQSFGLQEKLVGTVLGQINLQKARYYDYYKSGYYAKAYPQYYSDAKA